MQECERLSDLRIARSGEPTCAFRRELLHVAAKRFHEQSLGKLGKNRQSASTLRFDLSHAVAYRAFDRCASGTAAHVDLEYRRQAAQERALRMTLAAQVAADDPRDSSSATPLLGGQLTLRELRQQASPRKQPGGSSVPQLVSITLREDDDIPSPERYFIVTGRTSGRLPVRHEVKQYEPLTVR